VADGMVEDLYGEILGAGALVNDWLIDGGAGAGGQAVVYRARHLVDGRAAAVKLLRAPQTLSSRALDRFRREAEILRRLSHPAIARLYEVGELTDGRPYIAMEWLDGETLAEQLAARGPATGGETIAVIAALADALAAAHAMGLVHRDVKAGNVMRLADGDVRLLDFGIAKADDFASGLTSRSFVGTPQSAAPEQLRGGRIDARTDVYGLGVLTFHLLAGRLPFEGLDAFALEDQHLHALPPRLAELVGVPPAVDAVVAKALAKVSADRFASTVELAAALRAAFSAVASREVAGAALWLEVRAGDDDDATLDAVDAVLGAVETAAARHGLVIAVRASNAVLAVRLGDDADPAVEAAARELRAIAADRAHGAAIDVTLRVRAGTAQVDATGTIVDGDLVRPDAWPAR
jgi:tRNA A-37 threonylcarbamoyl transferase component Bud32